MKIGTKDAEHQRLEIKQNKESLVKAEIKLQMNENIPCLTLDSYRKNQFYKQQDEFLKLIQENYSPNYYVYAYNLVVTDFNKNIKEKKWNAVKLSKLSLERQESHFRSNLWFFRFDEFSKWVKLWEDYLSESQNKKFSKQDILASIALSSICYGGLNSPLAVLSLINTLTNNPKPLNLGDFYWIDILIYEKGFDKNFEINEEKVHIKTWYPDSCSLLWINNLLINFTFDITTFDLDSLSNFIMSWMKTITKGINSNFSFDSIKSFKDICDVGIGILESSQGTRLDQTLVGYAKGEIKSASLAPDYYENVLSNDFQILDTPYIPEKKKIKDREPNPFLISINNILNNKNKLNKEHKIEELYKLEPEKKSEYILLSWLIHHLKTLDNKVVTLRNYISSIGYNWLEISDATFMDYEELESYYTDLIEEPKSNCYGRLKDIHEYAIKLKEISEVSIFKNKFLQDTTVSTGFLTEKFFYNFISDLINSKNRYVRKEMYLALFIIAFRTGFRISEILKIRIRDIEINDRDLWINVKVNQYGTNKTKSATRKFPLGIFLTSSENKLIHKYIEIKKLKPNVKESTPLFGFDFNPTYGLTNTPVNRITRQYITKKYKTKITLHTFRHTALSRLHIILSDNEYLKTVLLKKEKEL